MRRPSASARLALGARSALDPSASAVHSYGCPFGPPGITEASQPQLPASGPSGQPIESSHLAMPVETGVTLGVYCEDSLDELWRRQTDINAEYEIDCELAGVHWLPRLGEDNLLMTFARGVGELTPFHSRVLDAALDLKARL